MPRYNLAAPEAQIVVTWLFEPNGYLDYAVRVSDGQTAREALAADPDLDVTQWVRDNELTEPEAGETGMIWWTWKNDQVNIPPPQRPAEAEEWAAILQSWDKSIAAGFARAPEAARNQTSVPLFDEAGNPTGTMPAGSQLAHQKNIISKVLGVLT